jgi:hypothetical protein
VVRRPKNIRLVGPFTHQNPLLVARQAVALEPLRWSGLFAIRALNVTHLRLSAGSIPTIKQIYWVYGEFLNGRFTIPGAYWEEGTPPPHPRGNIVAFYCATWYCPLGHTVAFRVAQESAQLQKWKKVWPEICVGMSAPLIKIRHSTPNFQGRYWKEQANEEPMLCTVGVWWL